MAGTLIPHCKACGQPATHALAMEKFATRNGKKFALWELEEAVPFCSDCIVRAMERASKTRPTKKKARR